MHALPRLSNSSERFDHLSFGTGCTCADADHRAYEVADGNRKGLGNEASFFVGRLAQIWAVPPSTNNSVPVMKLESPEARNSAAVAISRGCPKRPMGIIEANFALTSWGMGSKIAVSMGPGLMTFTRILRSLSSSVQVRANERTAQARTSMAKTLLSSSLQGMR